MFALHLKSHFQEGPGLYIHGIFYKSSELEFSCLQYLNAPQKAPFWMFGIARIKWNCLFRTHKSLSREIPHSSFDSSPLSPRAMKNRLLEGRDFDLLQQTSLSHLATLGFLRLVSGSFTFPCYINIPSETQLHQD